MKEILELYLYTAVPFDILITILNIHYWIKIYRYFKKNPRISISCVFNKGKVVFRIYGVTALLLSAGNLFGIGITYAFFSHDPEIFYLVYSSTFMTVYFAVVGFIIGSRKLVKYIENTV